MTWHQDPRDEVRWGSLTQEVDNSLNESMFADPLNGFDGIKHWALTLMPLAQLLQEPRTEARTVALRCILVNSAP
jgi:hypothetical protein